MISTSTRRRAAGEAYYSIISHGDGIHGSDLDSLQVSVTVIRTGQARPSGRALSPEPAMTRWHRPVPVTPAKRSHLESRPRSQVTGCHPLFVICLSYEHVVHIFGHFVIFVSSLS